MLFMLLACTDYELTDDVDVAESGAEDPGRPGDDGGGDGGDGGDSGDGGWDPDGPLDFEDCTDGYWADYYSLPSDHPEVEIDVGGVVTGDDPANHDWWDEQYYVRTEIDTNLEFGSNWWPVDEGLPGDPHYYAVHWFSYLWMEETGSVSFELGSDDDSWAYLDGELIADLGGIHGVEATTYTMTLEAGVHTLDLYMAERHTSDAGFWFRWNNTDLGYYACP